MGSIEGVPPVGALGWHHEPTTGLPDTQKNETNMADVDRITGSGVMRREWRELARFVVESFVAGLVVSLVMALAVFIVTTPAHAAPVRGARLPRQAGPPRPGTPAPARCT